MFNPNYLGGGFSGSFVNLTVTGDLQVDGNFIFGSASVQNLFLADDDEIRFGNTSSAPNSRFLYETADANANALTLILPAGGVVDVPVFVIGDDTAFGVDLGFFNGVTDPSVAVLSNDATKYVRMAHNGTNAALLTSSGSFDFNSNLVFSTGTAVTATNYTVGRNAAGTNQLAFNVPTAASFNWTVNNVSIATLTASVLALSTDVNQNGLTTYTGGTAVTAGNYQMGRDASATNFMVFNVPTGSGFLYSVQGTGEFGINANGAFTPMGNNFRVHNLADTVTNTESIYFDWAANVGRIYTFPTGTGTARTLQLSALNSSSGGGSLQLNAATPFVRLTHSTTSIAGSLSGYDATSTASSSTTNFFYITPSVNQSGTAGYNALIINPNVSTAGSGTQNFVSMQTSSTERYGVRVSGDVNHAPIARTIAVQPIGYTYTGAAHTGLSNAVYRDFYINNNRSVQFAGGGASIQYACGVEITPISFAAASAQSVSIITATIFSGGALAGTNLTATYQATTYGIFGTGKSANLLVHGLQLPGIDSGVGAMTSIHGFAAHAGASNVSLGNQTATLDRLAPFYNDAITFESTTNTRTVTEAAGAYFNAPIAGTNVAFTEVYGALVKTGSLGVKAGRILGAAGSNVASTNDMTLGLGTQFTITGTTQVNRIATAAWSAGSFFILKFADVVTVKHNQASGGGFGTIIIDGAADLVTTANQIVVGLYDGTNFVLKPWN